MLASKCYFGNFYAGLVDMNGTQMLHNTCIVIVTKFGLVNTAVMNRISRHVNLCISVLCMECM